MHSQGRFDVAWLEGGESILYKADRRSRVWRVGEASACAGAPEGLVLKRYEFSPWRQRLYWWLGLHPAQHEWRWQRRLTRRRLPAVPILGMACLKAGWGCHLVLATPWRGPTLLRRLREGGLTAGRRRQVAEDLVRLAADLLREGYVHRDFKTSNILLDKEGQLWLIDLVGLRRRWRPGQMRKMLRALDGSAASDGASRADRLRFVQALAEELPSLGPWRGLVSHVLGGRC